MSLLSPASFLVRRSIELGRQSACRNGRLAKHLFSTDRNDTLKSGDDETSLLVSKFKNQIVHQLWTERTKAKKDSAAKQLGADGGVKVTGGGKTPSQSETKVEYPFSKDELLSESYKR
jgi:hypothetical protein